MWCGVVQCGVVWCGVVQCCVVRCGVVWCGVVLCCVVWCHPIQHCNNVTTAHGISGCIVCISCVRKLQKAVVLLL